ncbi:MAG: tRNA (adenosine(37)-N6)-threonylcarbamoyltransferase complex dimerization subunit type 1 TsaB [Paracoccaceae bacterium]|jgi:tRNA threonylcarbamoyl adenosine modification protein YeaZ
MKPPLVLGFDTSGPHCAGAILSDGKIVATRMEEMTRGQAEQLMPLLERLLKDCAKHWRDVDVIGVGVGPGNFTGIRIAVSAARGLALGLDIPAVGVTGFEMRTELGVLPAVPAPREHVYVQPDGEEPRLVPLQEANAIADRLGLILKTEASPPGLAGRIARIAAEKSHDTSLPPAPLYLRDADAVPSRDQPPALLD